MSYSFADEHRAHSLVALQAIQADSSETFVADIRRGLSATPKSIPSMYLYDEVGSALFEAICNLSEYKCTAGEKRVLWRHAAEIAGNLPESDVVELGGSTGEKALVLLEAILSKQQDVTFHNIDVSERSLRIAQRMYQGRRNLTVIGYPATFIAGLKEVVRKRGRKRSLLVLFLGSSIGNFEPLAASKFLRTVRSALRPGDTLLLGTDLIKPEDRLLKAYDDPQGVTAAFNRNLLARINRELGADFDLCRFKHRARWQPEQRRIEMQLVSLSRHSVNIASAGMVVDFVRGEHIVTEHSHKYLAEEIGPWLRQSGFQTLGQWIDADSQFATTMARAL